MRPHLVLVNVDYVQLVLIRANRAATLLRLHQHNDVADALEESCRLLTTEIEKNRRRKEMKQLHALIGVLAVVLLVLFGGPLVVAGQDVVDVPATDGGMSPEFFVLAAVALGLLAAFVLVLRPLIVQLGASAPSWAVEAAFNTGTSLLGSAGKSAEKTETKIDDELIAGLVKEFNAMRREIEQMKAGGGPPVTADGPEKPRL